MVEISASILSRAEGFAECTVIFGGLNPRKATALFDPYKDLVAGALGVVAGIMVETDLLDEPRLEQCNRLARPIHPRAPFRRRSLIVQIDAHGTHYLANPSKSASGRPFSNFGYCPPNVK